MPNYKTLSAVAVFALAAMVLPSSGAEAAYGPSDTWAVAPQPSLPQIDDMVELNDGRVLLRHNQDSFSTPATYLYDPATNARTMVSTSVYAGRGSRLTKLADGRVLLSGYDGNTPPIGTGLAIFDPATDTFAPKSSLLTPRFYHTATLLADGRVLLAGGATTGSLTSAEIYDPITDTRTPAANMAAGRLVHAAVLLDDGRVLVAGGNTVPQGFPVYNPITSAEIYDPATDTWSPAGTTPPHLTSALAMLNDGRVLMAGGMDTIDPVTITDTVIYDAATNTWSPAASMPYPSDGQHHVTLLDGRVLVLGRGFDTYVQVYDPVSNTWSRTDDLIERDAATYSAAIRLATGEVLRTQYRTTGLSSPNIQIWDADADLDGFNDRRESQLSENVSAFCAIMRADLNTDGTVNSGDQLRLAQNYFSSPPLLRIDQNGDAKVNSGDQLRLAMVNGMTAAACPV